MKKVTKKKAGRPPSLNPANKSLGSVRVTEDQIEQYDKAAAIEKQSRADWIRGVLDKAASKLVKSKS